jgi:hypothetical protein
MITAVLDACVLVPIVRADTLLRCAERDLFRPMRRPMNFWRSSANRLLQPARRADADLLSTTC